MCICRQIQENLFFDMECSGILFLFIGSFIWRFLGIDPKKDSWTNRWGFVHTRRRTREALVLVDGLSLFGSNSDGTTVQEHFGQRISWVDSARNERNLLKWKETFVYLPVDDVAGASIKKRLEDCRNIHSKFTGSFLCCRCFCNDTW